MEEKVDVNDSYTELEIDGSLRIVPKNSFDEKFVEAVRLMVDKKFSKTIVYGGNFDHSLGAKGVFVDLSRKYGRLKRWFWEDVKRGADTESIEDTCIDSSVISLFLLMASIMEEEENDG
jgi:hypothetical protein